MDIGSKDVDTRIPAADYFTKHEPPHTLQRLTRSSPKDRLLALKLEYQDPVALAWYRGIGLHVIEMAFQLDGMIAANDGKHNTLYAIRNQDVAIDYAIGNLAQGSTPFLLEIMPGIVEFTTKGKRDPRLPGELSKEPVYLWMLSNTCKERIIKELRSNALTFEPGSREYKLLYDIPEKFRE